MGEFTERFGYMSEYSNVDASVADVGDLVAGGAALTLSQRLVLVGLRRDTEAWGNLGWRAARSELNEHYNTIAAVFLGGMWFFASQHRQALGANHVSDPKYPN